MPDTDCSDLLNFLSEPRSLREIAEHFGILASVAAAYLQEAIEQEQVLVCRYSGKASIKSPSRRKQRQTLFYISRDSNLLSKGLTGFAISKVVKTQIRAGGETAFVKFSSKSAIKSRFSSMAVSGSLEHVPVPQPLPRIKMRKKNIVRSARRYGLNIPQLPPQNQSKSLSATEKLSMLKTLSRRPLSYLDLRTLFDIPKRTVRTLVKNGLIEEVWGPKNIGIRFRLTRMGEEHLKRLKTAARLGEDKVRKATIRLKQRNL